MQETRSCLICSPPESHQPCTPDGDPRVAQTIAMTHIVSCMRPDADKASVYIAQETSSRILVRPTERYNLMDCHTPHLFSCSLQDLQTFRDQNGLGTPFSKSPSLATLTQGAASRFPFWPSSKSPIGLSRSNGSSEKLAALSVGRSSTSLSDTAALPESVPFWQRTGSLSRRRKVSVPELGNTMTTVQEMSIDSRKSSCKLPPSFTTYSSLLATIPGRPPLRKPSFEAFGHERSCSAPGPNWRAGPFGDAMIACVTGPSSSSFQPQDTLQYLSSDVYKAAGRPLSPILSPGVITKPSLKVDTANLANVDEAPAVPPKSSAVEHEHSPAPPSFASNPSKHQLTTPASMPPGVSTPLSAADLKRSPNGSIPLSTPPSSYSTPFYAYSPASNRGSPRVERRDPMAAQPSLHGRNMSESSIMERGRPKKRNNQRERSQTVSEANDTEGTSSASWGLPTGMRVPEASRSINQADQKHLHKQAYDQAAKFEVLSKRNVASMSRVSRMLPVVRHIH